MSQMSSAFSFLLALLFALLSVQQVAMTAPGAENRSAGSIRTPSGKGWKAGAASISITPEVSLWMAGYAARKRPSEGVEQPLHAKALALEDSGGRRAVLVTADVLGFPRALSARITERVQKQYGLARDRVLLNASHTHAGPVVNRTLSVAYEMNDEQWGAVETYTRGLETKIVDVIGTALKELAPATLRFTHTRANFAMNRRMPKDGQIVIGVSPDSPVDHDVPVLRVENNRGDLRAVVFGYACHNTTVGGDFYKFHGDYAGFAQEWLERSHPGVLALFVAGCGADANPFPRGTIELARQHGQTLAVAVDEIIGEKVESRKSKVEGQESRVESQRSKVEGQKRVAESPKVEPGQMVSGPLRTVFEEFPVAFATPPTREELEARLKSENIYQRRHAQEMLKILERDGRLASEYPYSLQIWRFGQDLTLVAMAGEVVVDYVLRLKREMGADKLWVAGYSNDVFAYIPSLRILQEGGYEGGGAMIYYVQPGPFAPSIEETIISKVHQLAGRLEKQR